MAVTQNARGLARAVLAGDARAVAGLLDEVQAEADLSRARAWLDAWDRFAGQAPAALIGDPDRDVWEYRSQAAADAGQTVEEHIVSAAFDFADAMMAERARRLRGRATGASP